MLIPTTGLIASYCKQTAVINGVTIPKGAIIAVPISVLHHSPLYWKDPEKFDPDRLESYSSYIYITCQHQAL